MLQNKHVLISLILLSPTIIQTALTPTSQALETSDSSTQAELTRLNLELNAIQRALASSLPKAASTKASGRRSPNAAMTTQEISSSRSSHASDDEERAVTPRRTTYDAMHKEWLRFSRENAELRLQAKTNELDLAQVPTLKAGIADLQAKLEIIAQEAQQKHAEAEAQHTERLTATELKYTTLRDSVDATVTAQLAERLANADEVKKQVAANEAAIRTDERAKAAKTSWVKYGVGALAGFGIAKSFEHGLPQRALGKGAQAMLWLLNRSSQPSKQ